MALTDNSYSRFVAWVKIILPIAAIALLSMMFLFARTPDMPDGIPFAEIDIEQLARDQRLTKPTYAGVTQDGRAISFEAEDIRGLSGQSGVVTATHIVARLTDPDGDTLRIDAPQAVIDQKTSTAELSGGINLSAPDDIGVQAEGLLLDLRETSLQSMGQVQIQTSFGRLQAGQMHIATKPETGGYLVDFTGGVKMLYKPDISE